MTRASRLVLLGVFAIGCFAPKLKLVDSFPDGGSAGGDKGSSSGGLSSMSGGSSSAGRNSGAGPNAGASGAGMAGEDATNGGSAGIAGSVGTAGSAGTGGSPPPPAAGLPGATCSAGTDCGSGHCVDGVCCLTTCDGACQACNLPASPGQCTSVSAGMPSPAAHPACAKQATSTCGTDGMCDGAGACRKYESGTVCAGGSCDATANKAVTGASCDGSGTCQPAGAVSCAPFKCSGDACATKCTGNSDCVNSAPCVNGSCGAVGDGNKCTSDAQCSNGHCADGYCCNSACTGSCQACDLSGHTGVCTTLPAAGTPHAGHAACTTTNGCSSSCDGTAAACAFTVGAACGTCNACTASGACQPVPINTQDAKCPMDSTKCAAGGCDGAGACKASAAGTACGAYTCTESTALGQYTSVNHSKKVCSGSGIGANQCATGTNEGCTTYACNPNNVDCKGSCTGDIDCLSGNYCKGGVCTPWLGIGATCTAYAQCASRICGQNGKCAACNDYNDCLHGDDCNSAGQCVTGSSSFQGCDPALFGQCHGTRARSCNAIGVCDCYGTPACAPGLLCQQPATGPGQCLVPMTYACHANSDCAGTSVQCTNGLCADSVCIDQGQCSPTGQICCTSGAPHCFGSCG